MPRKCKRSFKMKRTKNTFPYKGEHDNFVHGGDYKIVRKDLDEGVLGEAENGKIVNIDVSIPKGCLLYTSPSPRDGLLSRMPSSA